MAEKIERDPLASRAFDSSQADHVLGGGGVAARIRKESHIGLLKQIQINHVVSNLTNILLPQQAK